MAKFSFSVVSVIVGSFATCHGLLFPTKEASPPIKKVAIIGSGICGLTLAHSLENSEECAQPYVAAGGDISAQSSSNFGIETHVFDSRENLNYEAGAGIQLTGGM